MTPLSRSLRALADALDHTTVNQVVVNADDRQLLVTLLPDNPADEAGDEVPRLLNLARVADLLGLPEPTRSHLTPRAQSFGTPAYAPGVTVVLWTPVAAGVRAVV